VEEGQLGLLTRRLKSESNWRDKYPAWQVYADECEHLLEFLLAKGKLDHYWPRLCSKKQQRDETLNEMETVGTTVWHRLESSFQTGPETELLAIRFTRDPGNTHIKGKFWVDEVRLRSGR
jgi:hypothetical protein